MPNVNFYLKKPPGKLPYALIYLQFKYNGRKLVYSFGQKINPSDWSKTTKRVKSNRQTILDGKYAMNELLDKLEKHCLKAYQEERIKGVPPVPVLKFRLDAFMQQLEGKKREPIFYELIDRFLSGEIKNKGREKNRNTLKIYATTKSHLQAFDIKSRYHIHFENINLDFFHWYVDFLKEDLKLKPNSIVRDIGALKTILNEAVDRGYTTNIQFRHKKFSFAGEETDAVHLTEKEITRLYRFDCAGNKRLEQVRDLFVYSCFTGQRFFDGAGTIKILNIKEVDGFPFISLPTAAPGPAFIVPCHPLLNELSLKYGANRGVLPKAPSNQKFNDYLKEICRLAGLVEKGRLSTAPDKELWESVSSRTARLSMTAFYYRAGHPVHELMRVTGHTTAKAFLKYIHA